MFPGSGPILILDRDFSLRETLRTALLEQDLSAVAADARDTAVEVQRARPRLISLEIEPSFDGGTSMISQVRSLTNASLIAVAANAADSVRMLDLGADDTICKPLDLSEWMARVRALLRRSRSPDLAAQRPQETPRKGGWAVDRSLLKVFAPDGRDCDLTVTEFVVFDALSRNANRVLTREQIRDLVRGPHWSANDRLIDNQIGRLRRKLAASAINPPIKTVRGCGYMLSTADTEQASIVGSGQPSPRRR